MIWIYVITVVTIHLAALAALIPWLFSWTGVALAILGVPFYGMGITLGYHRLLAHRSLVMPKWLEHGFALLAQCSLQDTPAKWVTVHRMHHVFSDEQPDPHSPLVNFFWSHFDWLFYHNTATRTIGSMQKYAHDILEDPFYMRLEKTFIGPAIYLAHLLMYPIVGAVAGWFTTGTAMGALQFSLSLFVWGGLVRTVLGWHVTWSVNSLTHLFGYRNYETSESSQNNWFVGSGRPGRRMAQQPSPRPRRGVGLASLVGIRPHLLRDLPPDAPGPGHQGRRAQDRAPGQAHLSRSRAT